MNFLLEVTDYNQKIANIGDILSFGGRMVLIGMLTVFAVLFLIWFVLVLFSYIFKGNSNGTKKGEKTQSTAPVAAVSDNTAVNDDAVIVAVIAAAIAMAESESAGSSFRVVSFRRATSNKN